MFIGDVLDICFKNSYFNIREVKIMSRKEVDDTSYVDKKCPMRPSRVAPIKTITVEENIQEKFILFFDNDLLLRSNSCTYCSNVKPSLQSFFMFPHKENSNVFQILNISITRTFILLSYRPQFKSPLTSKSFTQWRY